MNNQLAPIDIIHGAEQRFLEIAQNNKVDIEWVKESSFAVQQIHKNSYTLAAAKTNPNSLMHAMTNVAAVGLSLNPATAYAYLVPRDDAICLDISYRGLIKIATDTGSIMWAKADVVYSTDTFEYNGPAQLPLHKANPFAKDRGDVVGVYCIAKTCDGDYLVEPMKEEEYQDIKNKSPSAKSKHSPHNTFPNEMRKKCVIKRASKTWPKTERHEHLDRVIEYVNKEEGIPFGQEIKEEDVKMIDDLLHQKNGAALDNLLSGDPDETMYYADIISTFAAKGQKGKHKAMVEEWRKDAREYVYAVSEAILATDDEFAIKEAMEEMNGHEEVLFWRIISPEAKIDIENKLHSITGDAA